VNYDVFSNDEYEHLEKTLNDYSDYLVIKTMHHPINWLGWDERVEKNVKSKFFRIKDFADLLLTGHEHVPTQHQADFLNNKRLLHIPSGCF